MNNNRFRPKQLRKSLVRIAVTAAIVLIGVSVAINSKVKSFNAVYSVPSGWTRENVSWRAHLFARKAEGAVPDLSWRELWFMARVPGGFGLKWFVEQGYSLEGKIENPYNSNEDRQAGARIFRERCSVCHGKDGTGGACSAAESFETQPW